MLPIFRRTSLYRPGRFSFGNNGNYNPSVVNEVFQSHLKVQIAKTTKHTCLNVLHSNVSIVLNSSVSVLPLNFVSTPDDGLDPNYDILPNLLTWLRFHLGT